MLFQRSEHNPIIAPQHVNASHPGYEVLGVFNAGVARVGNEIVLLLRVAERPIAQDPDKVLVPIWDADSQTVQLKTLDRRDPRYNFDDPRVITYDGGIYLTSISHLRLARSTDGVHFQVDDVPSLFPATPHETYGIEDPRITPMGDTYWINYSAISPQGICTCLASTHDFVQFKRHGVIFAPDNKDIALFPEKIGGAYWALHRPTSGVFQRNDIWLASSPDLLHWGDHQRLVTTRAKHWDAQRIGASAPPLRTEAGWLELYHGADAENRYCMGALLLDLAEPWRVLARSETPLLAPEAPYESNGFFGPVVFSCGALLEDKRLKVYYGVSDTAMAYAEADLGAVLDSLD